MLKCTECTNLICDEIERAIQENECRLGAVRGVLNSITICAAAGAVWMVSSILIRHWGAGVVIPFWLAFGAAVWTLWKIGAKSD